MMDEFKLSVKGNKVYEKTSDYLPDLEEQHFATKEERELFSYLYVEYVDDIYVSSTPIPIEVMKTMIEEAEAAGANFVTIDYHSDHDEYEVTGYKFERASDEDNSALELERRLADEEAKNKRIKELEEELEKLKGK